jgi:hypothetical protein
MPSGSTTVRVSRRTHKILADLAERRGSSVSDLLDHLAESARRHEILSEYNARIGELVRDPAERAAWQQETVLSQASAAEVLCDRAASVDADTAPLAR